VRPWRKNIVNRGASKLANHFFESEDVILEMFWVFGRSERSDPQLFLQQGHFRRHTFECAIEASRDLSKAFVALTTEYAREVLCGVKLCLKQLSHTFLHAVAL